MIQHLENLRYLKKLMKSGADTQIWHLAILCLFINFNIRSSEALYQALKYTEHPDIQLKILEQSSPMSAKDGC